MSNPVTPPGRSTAQTLLIAAGAVLMLVGLVLLVVGFARFGSSTMGSDLESGGDEGSSMAMFAGGGLALVVGLGVIGLTRAAVLRGRGAYSRITIEQGFAPPRVGPGAFCSTCGVANDSGARFCSGCGRGLA